MKRLIALIAVCLLPALAMAQPFVRNDEAASASYVVGNGDHQNSAASVDAYGRVFMSPLGTPISVDMSNANPGPVQVVSGTSGGSYLGVWADTHNSGGFVVRNAGWYWVENGTASSSSSNARTIHTSSNNGIIGDVVIILTASDASDVNSWSTICDDDGSLITLCSNLPLGLQQNDTFQILRNVPKSPEMTPVAMITILPTAIPTAYSTPQFANTAPLRSLTVSNAAAELWCAYGGSTTTHFRVNASEVFKKDFGANGESFSGSVGCIHPGATPASGTVAIWGER